MFTKLAAVVLAVAASAGAQQVAVSQNSCNQAPMYSPCEMVFELTGADAAQHPNPYRDVDLKVEFRSPQFRTLAIPAYWDGGHRLVVRFAPTEAGEWNYHVTSNVAVWNDKSGAFTAAASESKGFIHAENVHHWSYSERSGGLYQPHLWMGASEMGFATMNDAAFRPMADARSAAKFNHLRGLVLGEGAWSSGGTPSLEYFSRLDSRIRYLNQKGLIVDLVLAGEGALTRLFPTPADRRRFVRYLVARYAAMDVTWQGFDRFEDYPDGRAVLKEIGATLKELDPYQHPRSSGAAVTSSPLIDDGWQDYVTLRTADDAIPSIEHQIFPAPFVNLDFGREGEIDANTFRHRLWNATMDGQYVTYAGKSLDAAGVKAMSAWFTFFDDTRHWELEPYFDVNGGRALALEGTEYVVYVEHPGPVELNVEKHGYDVYWVNPADGESIKAKKYSGEYFTGEPPDKAHDWVLHVVREGRVESMNRSYKFESREIVMQEVEANTEKVPFAIEQPKGDLSMSAPVMYSAKMTRQSRATRWMMFLWKGEVSADHQGYRILATGLQTTAPLPADIARTFPAVMHLRLYGMNANGKVYEVDTACGIVR
jgi:hypothetical protein